MGTKHPGVEHEFDKTAKEMNIPLQMDNVDYGKKTKLVPRKIRVTSTDGTKTFYGSRTIMTKEHTLTFKDHLIVENEDLSALPDKVVSEIKSNIRKGAADLEQQWRDALELVHRAYYVTNIRRPTPDLKAAWKQYMDLIRYGVQQLRDARGVQGKWRMSPTLVREAEEERHIGKRRYFVEIPGDSPREVDAENMDDIIEGITNKLRREGAKLRVESRDKFTAVLTVWVDDVKRERIIVKEL